MDLDEQIIPVIERRIKLEVIVLEKGMVRIADADRPTFAYGYAEFTMKCPEEVTPTMTCTGLDAGQPLLVNGTIWVPEPEEEEVELESGQ